MDPMDIVGKTKEDASLPKDMAGKLEVCLMWGGQWNVEGDRYIYVADHLMTKSFMASKGATFSWLVDRVWSKTLCDRVTFEVALHHRRTGEKYYIKPPALINDDDDLDECFEIYGDDHLIPLYASFVERPTAKIVPRRAPVEAEYLQLATEHESQVVEEDYFVDCSIEARSTRETVDLYTDDRGLIEVDADDMHIYDAETVECGNDDDEHVFRLSGDEDNLYLHDLDDTNDMPCTSDGPPLSAPIAPPRLKRVDGSGMNMGDLFDNKNHFKLKVQRAAIDNHFSIRTGRSTVHMLELLCKDPSCEWRAVARKRTEARFFQLRQYMPDHTCSLLSQDIKNTACTSRFIATCMKERFANDIMHAPRACDVVSFAQNELHVPVSKWKSYETRKKAMEQVCGTLEENYGDMPAYLHMVKESNSDTVVDIKIGDDDRFLYCFIALGATIRGYKYMRHVICIDASFVQTSHKGQLVVAVAHDSDKHIFPVAWGIVDTESNNSWTWFLQRLKVYVVPDSDDLVIVSERHQAIKHSVAEVYLCVPWHLLQTL